MLCTRDGGHCNEKRNKYGAHNDGTKPVEIPQDEYIIYQDYFKKVTVMLVNYMDQEGKQMANRKSKGKNNGRNE